MQRPGKDEYEDYYGMYVDRVPDGDVVELLASQMEDTLAKLGGLDEEAALARYAPDKWSVKEVVGHVVDVERVFGLRALAFARADPASLPGMEQDDYVTHARFDGRPLSSLLDELGHLRASHVALFASFDGEVQARTGVASDCRFSVRAMPWIIAGHELHHRGVLRERYGL